jgi:hypothetical protein
MGRTGELIMDDFEARRGGLLAEHGQLVLADAPAACRLLGGAAAGLNAQETVAMRYPTRAAALAWHQLNHDHYGHASLGIVQDPGGDGWIGVMDIRKQLAAMRAEHDAQRRPGMIRDEGTT